VLVPKVGRAHNGRQVYSFGGVNIYLDQDVVSVEIGPAKSWVPTDLQALPVDVQRRQA
jgi:tuftelin-interacting protein 11